MNMEDKKQVEIIEVKQLLPQDFHISEAMKTLRTNILFSGANVCSIGITSCNENEGKSTIAFQLAASLAQSRKKVLFLDTDMRKSVISRKTGHQGTLYGLSHYLSGIKPLSEVLYRTDINNLVMVFAGIQPPNPTELLGSTIFSELLISIKEHFVFVIVDAPPVGRVIDYAVIAALMDGTLIVVDTQHNSYRQIRRVKTQIEKTGGKILGVVLNKVSSKDRGYYGKYGGYGGYGDYGNYANE
ncbi:MAG: CpsD/CapB family tyrosine-protein kinase [Clostridia bacterium]|nr:CpsD/CapB family tyrosine-protein kinase [Clostridia bacterium]